MSALFLLDPFSTRCVLGRCARRICATLLVASVPLSLAAQTGASIGVQRVADSSRVQLKPQLPTTTAPLDLYDTWKLGFVQSPQAKIALSRYAEQQEQKNISRGGLWPRISAGYSRSRVHGWNEQPNFFGQVVRSDLRYSSTNLNAQLRQPVLNYPRYAEYQRGKAIAALGQAQLALDQHHLSLQIAQTYFATLLAFEDWHMQGERVEFFAQRVQTFKELLRLDSATELELQETEARLATVQADRLRAADTLRIYARQLQALIGVQPLYLKQLQSEWQYQPLDHDLDSLLEQALLHNPDIQTAQHEMSVRKAALDAARSEYFPTLDLVISAGKANSEDLSTLSQRTNTFAIGLTMFIPIFTGGYTTAASTQARFQWQAAQHRYDAIVARAQADIQKQYGLYVSGARRVEAMAKAVESSQISLESMQKSYSVGAANNLEVLDAQDQLMQTRYNYYDARLQLLLAKLRLDAAVGMPLASTLQQIAQQQSQGEVIRLLDPLSSWGETANGWTTFTLQPSQPVPR